MSRLFDLRTQRHIHIWKYRYVRYHTIESTHEVSSNIISQAIHVRFQTLPPLRRTVGLTDALQYSNAIMSTQQQALQQVSSNLGITLATITRQTDAKISRIYANYSSNASAGREGQEEGGLQEPATEARFSERSFGEGSRERLHREMEEDEEWEMRSEAEQLLRGCVFTLRVNMR